MMMKITFILFAVPVAFMIAAIPGTAQQQRTYTYECDTGGSFSAQFEANSATVRLHSGQTITLPAVPASQIPLGPGEARYSDGNYLLFTSSNNNGAWVELNGDRIQDGCIAQAASSTSTSTVPAATPVRALW